jgi:hypothetical protein
MDKEDGSLFVSDAKMYLPGHTASHPRIPSSSRSLPLRTSRHALVITVSLYHPFNKCCTFHLTATAVTFTATCPNLNILSSKPNPYITTSEHKKVKVKVNFTLEQTTNAQRRSRGIALLFL